MLFSDKRAVGVVKGIHRSGVGGKELKSKIHKSEKRDVDIRRETDAFFSGVVEAKEIID